MCVISEISSCLNVDDTVAVALLVVVSTVLVTMLWRSCFSRSSFKALSPKVIFFKAPAGKSHPPFPPPAPPAPPPAPPAYFHCCTLLYCFSICLSVFSCSPAPTTPIPCLTFLIFFNAFLTDLSGFCAIEITPSWKGTFVSETSLRIPNDPTKIRCFDPATGYSLGEVNAMSEADVKDVVQK